MSLHLWLRVTIKNDFFDRALINKSKNMCIIIGRHSDNMQLSCQFLQLSKMIRDSKCEFWMLVMQLNKTCYRCWE